MDAVLLNPSSFEPQDQERLSQHFLAVREVSEQLCKPLEKEDYLLQAIASTSPTKWHLAHTTWFFETFLLKPYCSGYQVYHPKFEILFNSYYNGIGEQYNREQRGLLSRPTLEEVFAYRAHVNSAMRSLLDSTPTESAKEINDRVILGCHHEQQHQELFFTDLKYCWFQNPLLPVYAEQEIPIALALAPMTWKNFNSGSRDFGYDSQEGFCFDNELPRHPQYVPDFRIADRLVSNAEYAQFIDDNGYQRPDLWLADGWAAMAERSTHGTRPAPLYWVQDDKQWLEYTLHGLARLDPNRPVAHLSAYEADAYARWADARLPTEFEWETSVQEMPNKERASELNAGQFMDAALVHPVYSDARRSTENITGQLWQWTSSAYAPYPGFKAAKGAIGEYNGKFMANQLVLRGGSCVTSADHYRHSYRNFFYPPDQWQFTGLRLAKDA
jgi:ergothioneine biosynthesis protein EgtB